MHEHIHPGHPDLHAWALVLAAGEGRRLAALTTTVSGAAIPKQYCSLWGGRTLLEETLHRAQRVVARERVCAVVAGHHRQWWEPPMWSLPARNTIVQPENRGTSLGVLLPLIHIARRDPAALVLVLPSDHHVRDEAVLVAAMRRAMACAARDADAVVLLGFKPDDADSELGYIDPGKPSADGTFHVMQFVEKPPPPQARELFERQALWNGFILAASARALLGLYEARHPQIVATMKEVVERDADCPVDAVFATQAYERLPPLDFSRDVLQGMEARLRVLPVPECGWRDLGCPAGVLKVARRGGGRARPRQGPWSVPTINLAAQALVASSSVASGP